MSIVGVYVSWCPPGAQFAGEAVTFSWLDSYADPYSVVGLINIIHAEATAHGAAPLICTVELLDLSATGRNESVRVRAWDVAGVPAIDPRITLVATTGAV